MHTHTSLRHDLISLGVRKGDGLFVHASMGAIGQTIGGPRGIVETLQDAVGETGLIGMPGFSSDAYFPATIDKSGLSQDQITQIENNVLGFDILTSPTSGMGIIAETFRNWPRTQRSTHPAVSICLNGAKAGDFLREHSLAWATGRQTPLGHLYDYPSMKVLLIGVGWNRCSALHTAETFAKHRRTKTRRFKNGGVQGTWIETPDVADDMNRFFPAVGDAFEKTGAVVRGTYGNAQCLICDFRKLIDFASVWINRANAQNGALI